MSLLLLTLPAFAGDTTIWYGGAVSTGASLDRDPGLGVLPFQVEADARLETGPIYARVDLNVFPMMTTGSDVVGWEDVDGVRVLGLESEPGVADPTLLPEWAMVQVGTEQYKVRVGVTNPNFGLEDWDTWNNYLPTFSTHFNAATPGRILGAEPAMQFDDGTEIFAFGGYDLDFGEVAAGAGIWTEQDSWSTWSGVASYPALGMHEVIVAAEVYPFEVLWISVDGVVGVMGREPFAGGQVVFNIAPEQVVTPVVRLEGLLDPTGALGGYEGGVPDATASVGLRAHPTEFSQIAVEGKMTTFGPGFTEGGLVVRLDFFTPAPGTYTAVMEEE
ncbi:MAG: hypothetical protein ACOZNI_04025 [Myxococcota bacterium]